jgi:hypothetical protein
MVGHSGLHSVAHLVVRFLLEGSVALLVVRLAVYLHLVVHSLLDGLAAHLDLGVAVAMVARLVLHFVVHTPLEGWMASPTDRDGSDLGFDFLRFD